MSQLLNTSIAEQVTVMNPAGASSAVIVCEHASCFIPTEFADLGLSAEERQSHAVWDPGAMAVAIGLSERFDATLVASAVSRLVYDCNRPPSAADAMPVQSEAIAVPGNAHITQAQRADRVARFYEPFKAQLTAAVRNKSQPVIVTVHSFTPTYHDERRAVEIGVLHDKDARLADAMLDIATAYSSANVQRNAPYGPQDGVTHTLRVHAIPHGHLNVMLEIRNDLIKTAAQQSEMVETLAGWIAEACDLVGVAGGVQCQV